jgi:hypothetical protein
MTPADLRSALPANPWLDDALDRVAADPASIARLFPAAGRHCGRAPIRSGWTADEAARAVLLAALPPGTLVDTLTELYRYGDAAEKLAVLRALPLLPLDAEAVPLLADALRTNDTRLVAAALGPYAVHLDDVSWRQAVLKCVFMEIPLEHVDRLAERADAGLAGMLAALAAEKHAAGRALSADAAALLAGLTNIEEP